ncbi:MAG: polysaccharide deacetylase family protein [Lautropia sp.]
MAATAALTTAAAAAVSAAGDPGAGSAGTCRGTVYLTLDTGSMRHAEPIAAILRRHQVRATFFVANETTEAGDGALDPRWRDYWRARVAEGHAFGSHTFDHVYFSRAGAAGRVAARPQFGAGAGRLASWDAVQVCAEIDRADARFRALTERPLDRLWRAPGGRGPAVLFEMAENCGWRHVGWSPAGFLGDELPSDRFPNAKLLAQSLRAIGDGDILMAHLGIRSRADPYAPTLEPLIAGLKARGLCFATITEHPRYRPGRRT